MSYMIILREIGNHYMLRVVVMSPDWTPMRVPKTLVLDFVKGMWGSTVVPFSYVTQP